MNGAPRLAVVVLTGLLLTGCTPVGQTDASATAGRFQELVATQDWTGACALLSERARTDLESAAARPCAEAVTALRLPTDDVGTVQVWGHNAEATVGQHALFLSEFSPGWRVIAAGCTSQGEDRPDQCAIGG